MKNKEDVNILFKQGNTDERILKSIGADEEHQYDSEELSKAMNRVGLVQKEVQVQGKNGQTFTRKQWVKASEDQTTQKQPKVQEESKDNDSFKKDLGDNILSKFSSVQNTDKMVKRFSTPGSPNIKNIQIPVTSVSKAKKFIREMNGVNIQNDSKDYFDGNFSLNNTKVSFMVSKGSIVVSYDNTSQTTDSREDKSTQIVSGSGGENKESNKKISSISQKGYRVSINNGDVIINTMAKPISEHKVGTDMVCQFKGTDGNVYEVTRDISDGKTAPKVKSVKPVDASNITSANNTNTKDTSDEDKKSSNTDKTSKSHWTKVGTSEQAKAQIAQMLASGKSREDCMTEFKSQGVTWKESDNAGINWMRAAMAMNKHLTSGASEHPTNTDSSISKPKESKDTSKKSEVKSVVGSDYTKLSTEKESGTIEGEAHNMVVGKLGSEGKKKPTEKEIKAAATSLKDNAMKTVISSYNQDTLVHQLAMAKQFTKLAGGNMDHMTLENIYKDVVSGQGSYTQEQKCNALAKLCGKDYTSFDDDIRRYASNSLANVSITPKSKGYFDVKFSYDDGASRTERFDSVKSAKKAADSFIDKEEKYADEKKSR